MDRPIIRTPTRAEGGITPEERKAMDCIAQKWVGIARRTDRVAPDEIAGAVHRLYAAAGLKAPRVVVCPSPLVMAYAYGAAVAIWGDATATDDATRAATYVATRAATDDATYVATRAARRACLDMAGPDGLAAARIWCRAYEGGAYWPGWCAMIEATRDVLGLRLPEFSAYQAWEDCAKAAPFRVLHPEFCMVSDFPEVLRYDDDNLPHCDNGPSHRWRDGWALYHWHGVRVPGHWIERPDDVDPAEVIAVEDVEQRAAGCAILGWPRMAPKLARRVIDGDPSTERGALIELTLPGLPEPGRFLEAICPRNGTIVEGVPRISDIDGLPIETAAAAQAWRERLPATDYEPTPFRT